MCELIENSKNVQGKEVKAESEESKKKKFACFVNVDRKRTLDIVNFSLFVG